MMLILMKLFNTAWNCIFSLLTLCHLKPIYMTWADTSQFCDPSLQPRKKRLLGPFSWCFNFSPWQYVLRQQGQHTRTHTHMGKKDTHSPKSRIIIGENYYNNCRKIVLEGFFCVSQLYGKIELHALSSNLLTASRGGVQSFGKIRYLKSTKDKRGRGFCRILGKLKLKIDIINRKGFKYPIKPK